MTLARSAQVPPLADAFEIEDHISLTAHGHDGHATLTAFVLLPIFGGLTRQVLHQASVPGPQPLDHQPP